MPQITLPDGSVRDYDGAVHGGGLVADRDEADLVLVERGEQRIDLGARKPEHEAHAFGSQAAREQLSTRDLGHGVLLHGSYVRAYGKGPLPVYVRQWHAPALTCVP